MIAYRIDIADAHAHLFRVTLTVPQPAAEQRVSLPVWIPGSYLVREFARHLSGLQATQGKRARSRCSSSTRPPGWPAVSGRGALTLSYLVYAFDNSVRTAFLDANRGFFNGTSVFLRVQGREAEPHRVELRAAGKGWQVATAPAGGEDRCARPGQLRSGRLRRARRPPGRAGHLLARRIQGRGVPHEFVVAGACPISTASACSPTHKRICEAEIASGTARRSRRSSATCSCSMRSTTATAASSTAPAPR
jgi:predicted metalloprotease with PDZ domain